MFTSTKYANKEQSTRDYVCLSSDSPLPTDGITNGSICLEMDTGKFYAFDEANSQWIEIGA